MFYQKSSVSRIISSTTQRKICVYLLYIFSCFKAKKKARDEPKIAGALPGKAWQKKRLIE